MAAAILDVLRDPERAERIARNAARLVTTRYSPAAFAERARSYAASIESLLASERR
jgi:glycosyltransferase involved in cell wall biosynthesis